MQNYQLIPTLGFRVYIQALGRVDLIGYIQSGRADTLWPVFLAGEPVGSRPIYEVGSRRVSETKTLIDRSFFIWKSDYNLFVPLDHSLLDRNDSGAHMPQIVDKIVRVLLSDLGNAKQMWSVLRTLIDTSELEECYTLIHVFSGGWLLQDVESGVVRDALTVLVRAIQK